MAYRKPTFGPVSEGTLRDCDLIKSFAWELRYLLNGVEPTPKQAELLRDSDGVDEDSDEDSFEGLVDDLMDALGEFAQPYTYFGNTEGDGAMFGWWPDVRVIEDAVSDGEVLQVNDSSEIPEDHEGEVMIVNDHGNITFGFISAGEFTETWSCV